jgi:hypothetical protein
MKSIRSVEKVKTIFGPERKYAFRTLQGKLKHLRVFPTTFRDFATDEKEVAIQMESPFGAQPVTLMRFWGDRANLDDYGNRGKWSNARQEAVKDIIKIFDLVQWQNTSLFLYRENEETREAKEKKAEARLEIEELEIMLKGVQLQQEQIINKLNALREKMDTAW